MLAQSQKKSIHHEFSECSEVYFNRDSSWLEFNRRVLFQAQDKNNPLLERVRFLSIFSSNLDEFFMKRVGYLKRIKLKGGTHRGLDGRDVWDVLENIKPVIEDLVKQRDSCYHNEIIPELQKNGIVFKKWQDLTKFEVKKMRDYFYLKVFPVLTPLAMDPSHPFPFISNMSLSLGIKLRVHKEGPKLFARVKIPDSMQPWIKIESEQENNEFTFIRLTDVVEHNLQELFPEMIIESVIPFRVTRNANIDLDDDESEDLLEIVEEELRLRRFAQVVRLEHMNNRADPWMMDLLKE